MINLSTNRPAYASELCEVVRLFYGMVEIEEGEFPTGLQLHCHIENGRATASVLGASYTDPHLPTDLHENSTPLEIKKYEKRAMKSALYRVLKHITGMTPPWGALTGIRPTRLAREFAAEGGMDHAETMLKDRFDVSAEKIALVREILSVQQPVMATQQETDFDIYAGIPFCRTRCLYCSFAAYEVGKGCATAEGMEAYTRALCAEITENVPLALAAGYRPRSLYIGGGTPTALSCEQLERVVGAMVKAAGGTTGEFTVEAGRPDTITEEKLRMLKDYGVTRISINPQTMNDSTLALVGRDHTADDIVRCYELARRIGFDFINMDTIIGLPGEMPQHVRRTMERIGELAPENLTVHTLAIKRSSKLKERLGDVSLPDARDAEEMLAIANAAAADMGLSPYYMYRQKYMRGNLENVGYARPGYASVYNIDIMEETTSIMALGAGAITKWLKDGGARLERIANPKDLATYLAKAEIQRQARKELIEAP